MICDVKKTFQAITCQLWKSVLKTKCAKTKLLKRELKL